MQMQTHGDPAAQTRHLVRAAVTGALATCHHETGVPYASLVAVATAPGGEPVLLLSDLALHTKNLKREPRASLLVSAMPGHAGMLDHPRATLMGVLDITRDAGERARYLRRHPDAGEYADFADFRFYRMQVETAHYVGGFGRIHDLEGDVLFARARRAAAISSGEPGILEHMNTDHADAICAMATRLLGLPSGGWRMIGCDQSGCDLRLGQVVARLEFETRAETLAQVRRALAGLAKAARDRDRR